VRVLALAVSFCLLGPATAQAATRRKVEQIVRTDLVSTAINASWYGPHHWVDDYTLIWDDVSTDTTTRCTRRGVGWACPWTIRVTVDATGERAAEFVGCRRLRPEVHGLAVREEGDCGLSRRRGVTRRYASHDSHDKPK
jgi:hypothetical protein